MSDCMNPKQAKKDESLLGELEKWEDTLKELRGSGATELGADYKLTAIRAIATTFIRDKMDFADTTEDQNDHEARFRSQYETLRKWAYMRVKNDRKTDPSHNNSASMDINRLGNERPHNEERMQYLNYMSRKGKGGYDKGKGK